MEISLDNFFVDIVVIMGYNKKNRAVFLNKNRKKRKISCYYSEEEFKKFPHN